MNGATKLVADTNIYLAAMRGPGVATRFFSALAQRNVTLVYSPKLLLEIQEAVETGGSKGTYVVDPFRRAVIERIAIEHGVMRRDPPLRNPLPLTRDRDDDFLVALTLSTGSVLVTGDADLQNSEIPDLAWISLSAAVTSLEESGHINVAMADRTGGPLLAM